MEVSQDVSQDMASSPRRRRPLLAAGEALVAVSAFGGAVGLTVGSIDLGMSVAHRLPMESPTLGGVALAAVGLPMSLAALEEWRATGLADVISVAAGTMLVGWIVVELVTIRTFSWLQPVFALGGVAVAVTGWRGRPSHSTAS